MSRYLLFLFFTVTLNLSAQNKPSHKKKLLKPGLVVNDSLVKKIQQLKDSVINTALILDSVAISEHQNNGLNDLIELQRKNESKQKRNAFIRIGIGLLFLAVLIAGLIRRKRKKAGDK